MHWYYGDLLWDCSLVNFINFWELSAQGMLMAGYYRFTFYFTFYFTFHMKTYDYVFVIATRWRLQKHNLRFSHLLAIKARKKTKVNMCIYGFTFQNNNTKTTKIVPWVFKLGPQRFKKLPCFLTFYNHNGWGVRKYLWFSHFIGTTSPWMFYFCFWLLRVRGGLVFRVVRSISWDPARRECLLSAAATFRESVRAPGGDIYVQYLLRRHHLSDVCSSNVLWVDVSLVGKAYFLHPLHRDVLSDVCG